MNKTKKSPLAEKIIAMRRAKGMTQTQISEALNIKRSTYARYECSTMPPADILRKLAKIFDTTVDFLLGYKRDFVVYTPNEIREEPVVMREREGHSFQATPLPGTSANDEKIFFYRYKLLPPELKLTAQEYMEKLINEMDK